ncbi:MAG: response regulator transcription factor [Salibacteraceae bacterium]
MEILIIEDEPSLANLVKKSLEEVGFNVTAAYDGITGLRMAQQQPFDLILLDLILPGLNGLEVCQQLRKNGDSNTPILMLTALRSPEDIVTGLDAGADDYLGKPFEISELLARCRAMLRRKNLSISGKRLLVADLEMDLDRKTVVRNGKPISLTAREYNLLAFFIRNKNRVVSRSTILDHVWGVNFDLGTNVVDVYVNYLRKKIDKDFPSKLIHTRVGMGYVLSAEI